MELKATKLVHVGLCDNAHYPIAKKKTSFEFLREKMHLRARTNTISCVARIRNALAFATHKFFQENGFLYVHTPIITASDCEGAGEMFQVGGCGYCGALTLQTCKGASNDILHSLSHPHIFSHSP